MKQLNINNFPKTVQTIQQFIDDLINKVPESARPQSTTITFNGDHFNAHLELDIRALSVEYGRGPGKFPPQNAIMGWIEKKGIVPHYGTSKIPSIKQLCFLISKSISYAGTKWYREKGIRGIGRYYEPNLKAIQNEWEEKIGQVFYEEMISNLMEDIEEKIM